MLGTHKGDKYGGHYGRAARKKNTNIIRVVTISRVTMTELLAVLI